LATAKLLESAGYVLSFPPREETGRVNLALKAIDFVARGPGGAWSVAILSRRKVGDIITWRETLAALSAHRRLEQEALLGATRLLLVLVGATGDESLFQFARENSFSVVQILQTTVVEKILSVGREELKASPPVDLSAITAAHTV
jgi:hypothetical protein